MKQILILLCTLLISPSIQAQDTTLTRHGTVFLHNEMVSVPSVGGSLNDVLRLIPQVSRTTQGLALGGGNFRESRYLLNGMSIGNDYGAGLSLSAGGLPVSLDALERVEVDLTPYDVRQSGFLGGGVNAVSRRGSNEPSVTVYNNVVASWLQGSRVEEVRNAGLSFNKQSFFKNRTGVSVGGPLVRDRLFFFLNAEYDSDVSEGPEYHARNTADSPYGQDKGYSRPIVSEMEEIRSFLKDRLGYDPGRYQDYRLFTPDYRILMRLDGSLGSSSDFSINVIHSRTSSSTPTREDSPLGAWRTDRNYQCLLFESTRQIHRQSITSMAGELNTRLFNGLVRNRVHLAWSFQNESIGNKGAMFPTVDISVGKMFYTSFGIDPMSYGSEKSVRHAILTDEVSLSAGAHSLLVGAQFDAERIAHQSIAAGAGWFSYESFEDFKNDVAGASASPGGFMITNALRPAIDRYRTSLYVQDQITVGPRFFLSAGARFEHTAYRFPLDVENKDFSRIGSIYANVTYTGLRTDQTPSPGWSFSPRLGFSWDIFGNRRMVVSGNSGIYVGSIPASWLVAAATDSRTLSSSLVARGSSAESFHFTTKYDGLIRDGMSLQEQAAPPEATVLSRGLKPTSIWKSSLSADICLPGDIRVSMEGIYGRYFNEIYSYPLGFVPGGLVCSGDLLDPEEHRGRQYEEIRNSAGEYMKGYYLCNENDVHGIYTSLTGSVEKTFPFGLSLSASYVHSLMKRISNGTAEHPSGLSAEYWLNFNFGQSELGYTSYVSPDRVIAVAGYVIPWKRKSVTTLHLVYEGCPLGYVGDYDGTDVNHIGYDLVSRTDFYYTKNPSRMLYIPTEDEISQLKEQNRSFWAGDLFLKFIEEDSYLRTHRGHYMERNGCLAPWRNQIDVRLAQKFRVGKHSMEAALDIRNFGNLLCRKWGNYQYVNSRYVPYISKYSGSIWLPYADSPSVWSMQVSLRWVL